MGDLRLSDLMKMQRELQEKHKGEWAPSTPENGRSSLLWVVEELGEVVSVIKKRGEEAIINDTEVREAFLEEFVDVFMFLTDALMCYGFTAEDLAQTYRRKHEKNMGRNWREEEASYIRRT